MALSGMNDTKISATLRACHGDGRDNQHQRTGWLNEGKRIELHKKPQLVTCWKYHGGADLDEQDAS
eukprot:scaffold12220_cov204-Skeletonema_marinoi.AAC.4